MMTDQNSGDVISPSLCVLCPSCNCLLDVGPINFFSPWRDHWSVYIVLIYLWRKTNNKQINKQKLTSEAAKPYFKGQRRSHTHPWALQLGPRCWIWSRSVLCPTRYWLGPQGSLSPRIFVLPNNHLGTRSHSLTGSQESYHIEVHM